MASGIYQIRNVLNGKRYLGSAVNLIKRWGNHRTQLRKGIHKNPRLQAAWSKYGEDAFVFETVESPVAIPQLLVREQCWLDGAVQRQLYNIDRIAGNRLGHRLSKEAREKLRIANTGKQATQITRRRMSQSQLKRWVSVVAREKQSLAHIGKRHTATTRQKMGKAIAEGKHQRSRLTWIKVRRMRQLYTQRVSQYVLGRMFDISRDYAGCIVRNEQWVDPTYHPYR